MGVPTGNELSQQAAQVIDTAFDLYQSEFRRITRKAKQRFEQRDWQGAQFDAIERLDLYKNIINPLVAEVRQTLKEQTLNKEIWRRMKAFYSSLIDGKPNIELAETFFNSVTRRIFATVGVDPDIEFVDPDFVFPPLKEKHPIHRTYRPEDGVPLKKSLPGLLEQAAQDFAFDAAYRDRSGELQMAAEVVIKTLQREWSAVQIDRIEMISSVFYRDNAAYLIGRICRYPSSDAPLLPLVLCWRHDREGIFLDAVLMDEDQVSILFSFAHSYFHVEVERPFEMIRFISSMIPRKRIAELYISLGYNKHGKTELYRDLLDHLDNSDDKFEIARGERGMVMAVFTMPSYDMVFKVIKDKIEQPKNTSRAEVRERYDLVFKHDRAGRLVDAQEFEHLSFDRDRFQDSLLEYLLESAPSQVSIDERCVDIKHLYTERRTIPLNLYVQEADPSFARAAVLDYGRAIKDLAATNVFPGDILLKNFGVTRHGRVVFYDYDELTILTACRFRMMPRPRSMDEEFAAEPWFYVGPRDIFPEQFRTFLGLQGGLRAAFVEEHEDLFNTRFWREMQSRHEAGEVPATYPYPDEEKLLPQAG